MSSSIEIKSLVECEEIPEVNNPHKEQTPPPSYIAVAALQACPSNIVGAECGQDPNKFIQNSGPLGYPPVYAAVVGNVKDNALHQPSPYINNPELYGYSMVNSPAIHNNRPPVNFNGALILSAVVFCCCGGIFGLGAFLLAILGQWKYQRGDITASRKMLKISYILSIVGIVVTTIFTIALIAYYSYFYDEIMKEFIKINSNTNVFKFHSNNGFILNDDILVESSTVSYFNRK